VLYTTFLRVSFTNPRGAKVTDLLILNRDRDSQWVSFSPWVGKRFQGDTEMANTFQSGLIYMKEDDSVIGLVRGVSVKSIPKFGETGTGKFYVGNIPYSSPIDYTWECVPAPPAPAVVSSDPPSPPASAPSDAIYIRPFSVPDAVNIRPFRRPP
jgi:hypothetical protein